MSDANVAIITRPGAVWKTSSKAGSITFSDGVHPGRGEVVLYGLKN
jgi:hypothetical protein